METKVIYTLKARGRFNIDVYTLTRDSGRENYTFWLTKKRFFPQGWINYRFDEVALKDTLSAIKSHSSV